MTLTPFINPRDQELQANYLAASRDPEVLSIRDARTFQNQPYRAKIEGDTTLVLSGSGSRQSFVELNRSRTSAQAEANDASTRWRELTSSEGTILNNVGISAEVTLTVQARRYL